MSYEIWLQSFEFEQESPLVESAVIAVFGPFLDTSDGEVWRLRYDELNSCDVHPSRAPYGGLVGVTFHRPCEDSRLWTAMYDILCLLLRNWRRGTSSSLVPLLGGPLLLIGLAAVPIAWLRRWTVVGALVDPWLLVMWAWPVVSLLRRVHRVRPGSPPISIHIVRNRERVRVRLALSRLWTSRSR